MVEKLTECALSELDKGIECVDTKEYGEVIDMIKDLCDSEYHARISKAMEIAEEEEKEEEKFLLKKFKEEYGMDDEESRRFYDHYRYADGRFAPKGRGTYRGRGGRRGYDEIFPIYEDDYWNRDIDREYGKMYYGNIGTGRVTDYGHRENIGRDIREGRSGQSRKSYMESKEMHKGSPDNKKELEKYMKELGTDITEMISDSTPEEKNMLRD